MPTFAAWRWSLAVKDRACAGKFWKAPTGELIIPMNPRCESLNAAVAAAIVMWQMKQ